MTIDFAERRRRSAFVSLLTEFLGMVEMPDSRRRLFESLRDAHAANDHQMIRAIHAELVAGLNPELREMLGIEV